MTFIQRICLLSLGLSLAFYSALAETCTNEACSKYAKMVVENLDTSVDPCDDFYQFTCGNYMRDVEIPSDKSQLSQFQSLDISVKTDLANLLAEPVDQANDILWTRNAKNYYESCINLDKVNNFTTSSAKVVLDSLGGWPLLSGQPNPNTPESLIVMINQFQLMKFVSISVQTNPKDPMKKIIKITQPEYLPAVTYDDPEYAAAYKTYYKTVLSLLNKQAPVNDSDIDDIYELEKSLAKAQMTISERKLAESNIEMTVADIQSKVPGFPWVELISSNGLYRGIDGFDVNETEPISVDDMAYLLKMQSIYSDYATNKTRILQNYLLSSFFYDLLNELMPVEFLQAKLGLTKFQTGASTLEERTIRCVGQASSIIPNEIGKLYVSKRFGSEAKADSKEMTKMILAEFKTILKNLTWMDDESKQKAMEKVDFIGTQIGYPDSYDNPDYINSNFVYVLNDYDQLNNTLTALQYSRRMKLESLRKPVDRDEWFVTPAIVNAMYEPNNNQIYFPAGILNPPFYHPDLPKYINYGAIGTVIGHELTHGFDDQGRNYDKYGRYYSDSEVGLWTNSTIEAFKSRAQCMIDEYNGYLVKEINMTVNGLQTLGENIADNGGLKEAFRSYKNWLAANPYFEEKKLSGLNYTNDQMFYISISQVWCTKMKKELLKQAIQTDPHSPAQFRVIGMAQNSDEFRQAFECLNPRGKVCSVW